MQQGSQIRRTSVKTWQLRRDLLTW